MVILTKQPYKFILGDTDNFTKVYAPERSSHMFKGFFLKKKRRMKQSLLVTALSKSLLRSDYVATFTNGLKTTTERNLFILRYTRKNMRLNNYPLTRFGRLNKDKIFYKIQDLLFFTHRLMAFRNLTQKLSRSHIAFDRYDFSRILNKQMMFYVWLNFSKFTFNKPFMLFPQRRQSKPKKLRIMFAGFKFTIKKYLIRFLLKKSKLSKFYRNKGTYIDWKKFRHWRKTRPYRMYKYLHLLKPKFKKDSGYLKYGNKAREVILRRYFKFYKIYTCRPWLANLYKRKIYYSWKQKNPHIPKKFLFHRKKFLSRRWYHCLLNDLRFTPYGRKRKYRKFRRLLNLQIAYKSGRFSHYFTRAHTNKRNKRNKRNRWNRPSSLRRKRMNSIKYVSLGRVFRNFNDPDRSYFTRWWWKNRKNIVNWFQRYKELKSLIKNGNYRPPRYKYKKAITKPGHVMLFRSGILRYKKIYTQRKKSKKLVKRGVSVKKRYKKSFLNRRRTLFFLKVKSLTHRCFFVHFPNIFLGISPITESHILRRIKNTMKKLYYSPYKT